MVFNKVARRFLREMRNRATRLKQTKESIKLAKYYNRHFLLFAFCLFLFSFFLGATALPVNGAVDYLEQMGVLRLKETIDAPNFILPDLEGRKRSLREFQGKFVMLNFWATW